MYHEKVDDPDPVEVGVVNAVGPCEGIILSVNFHKMTWVLWANTGVRFENPVVGVIRPGSHRFGTVLQVVPLDNPVRGMHVAVCIEKLRVHLTTWHITEDWPGDELCRTDDDERYDKADGGEATVQSEYPTVNVHSMTLYDRSEGSQFVDHD